jgi:copper(I)-binding protein
MKNPITVAAALLLALLSALPSEPASAAAPAAGRVVTEAGWTRAMPAGATVSAGYLRIRNTGSAADRLVKASSSAARSVELHETSMVDGDMQMRQIELLELAPGAVADLAPGGMHLMLIGLTKPLKVGDVITVTLQFERAGRVKAQLRVRPIGATGP